MIKNIWSIIFVVLFMVWFLVRAYYGRKARSHNEKEKVRPGFESFLVGLNFIGMMILPLIVLFTPYLDQYSMHIPDCFCYSKIDQDCYFIIDQP